MTIFDLNPFARAYVTALFFADCGEDGQPASDADLAPETVARIAADCAAFESANAANIAGGCKRGSGEYTTAEQAGHDFYLTRQRHGVGFWDGDWPEPAATRLTDAAHAFKEAAPYAGDDGLIYLE
jgi:hypothetical protein